MYIYHQIYHILYILKSYLYHIVTYAHILKKTNSTGSLSQNTIQKKTQNFKTAKKTSGLPHIINEGDIVRTRSFILNRQKGRGRPRLSNHSTPNGSSIKYARTLGSPYGDLCVFFVLKKKHLGFFKLLDFFVCTIFIEKQPITCDLLKPILRP